MVQVLRKGRPITVRSEVRQIAALGDDARPQEDDRCRKTADGKEEQDPFQNQDDCGRYGTLYPMRKRLLAVKTYRIRLRHNRYCS